MTIFSSFSWIRENLFENLLHYVKISSESAKVHGNKQQEEIGLLLLGYSYIEKNQHSNAIEQFEEVLKIAEDEKDNEHKTKALIGLGEAYKNSNKSERAIEYFKKALESAKGQGTKQQQEKALLLLGYSYTEKNQHLNAIEQFEEVLKIAEDEKDNEHKTKALIGLGEAYKNSNKSERAIEYCRKALAIAKEEGDVNGEKEATKLVESLELWEWKESSVTHRKALVQLLECGKNHQDEIQVINGVRFCCSEEFRIGLGRNGTRVYVGLDKNGNEMAVKRVPSDVCPKFAEQEMRVSKELSEKKSNHVVNYRCIDSTSNKEYIFVIMDLCEETLENFVKRSEEDDLAKIAPDIITQILKGLADLHRDPMPILHRDLQPSNILRNVQNGWLLADFGVSRILDKDATVRSNESGERINNWKAAESNETDDGAGVRYKKESDIQVAGMVSYYIATKGQHAFGKKPDRLRNLIDGKPVGLEKLNDPVLKDLLSWMLSHDLRNRPSAEEALKHPYFQSSRQQLKMMCAVGKQPEIKIQDGKSYVVQQLNNDLTDWRNRLPPNNLKCSSSQGFLYGSSWTECLRFVRKVTHHWHERPHPILSPEALDLAGDPQQYFLQLFPDLPLKVHRIIRSCDWKERKSLKKYFTEDTAAKKKRDRMRQKNLWFERTFLDSNQRLKEEMCEKLERFPWLCGTYGVTGPNKKIPNLHLFLTVKSGAKESDVLHDLKVKFECDAKEYFELLQKPKRQPKVTLLADTNDESSTSSSAPSLIPSPGGGVLACVETPVKSPLCVYEESERDDIPEKSGSAGTLTMFCFTHGKHYALTCFHVGSKNDGDGFLRPLAGASNKKGSTKLSAMLKTYWYKTREESNDGIVFDDDGSNYKRLGVYNDHCLNKGCDIMSLEVSENTEVNCKIVDVTSPDWNRIWKELKKNDKRVKKSAESAIRVEKEGFSSGLTYGQIVCGWCGDKNNSFRHAIIVKGCNGPFAIKGDSGAPLFFIDKRNKRQVFAYVAYNYDIDEFPLTEHEQESSDVSDSDVSDSDCSSTSSEEDSSCGPQDDNMEHKGEEYEYADQDKSDDESECGGKVEVDKDGKHQDEAEDQSDVEIVFSEESKTGQYIICLPLDIALTNLGLKEAACFGDCRKANQ